MLHVCCAETRKILPFVAFVLLILGLLIALWGLSDLQITTLDCRRIPSGAGNCQISLSTPLGTFIRMQLPLVQLGEAILRSAPVRIGEGDKTGRCYRVDLTVAGRALNFSDCAPDGTEHSRLVEQINAFLRDANQPSLSVVHDSRSSLSGLSVVGAFTAALGMLGLIGSLAVYLRHGPVPHDHRLGDLHGKT